MKIEINLDPEDFNALWVNSMEWKSISWPAQDGRFVPYIRGQSIEWNYRHAYWFDQVVNMFLAREYLKAEGWSF